MGIVYLASRADEQSEKEVAVKLLPWGLETAETARRFLGERQVLAQLEHPNIARLLDGGVTDEGYPYLVMERVEGSRSTRYLPHSAARYDRAAFAVPGRLRGGAVPRTRT